MPNRILKEGITTSCEVDNLTAEEERLFYRLIVVCDDFGRMDARPQIIRAKCFPLKIDTVKDKDIEKWLTSLVTHNLVVIYSANGKNYLQMTTWEKHQQKRAKHSKYPSPDNGMIANDFNCDQLQDDVPEKRETRNEKRSMSEINNFFESVWNLYPEKKGKAQISDSNRRKLFEVGYETLKRCIERYKKDKPDWKKWQHGSTFFNSGYIDYLDENYTPEEEPKPQCQMSRREQIERGLLSE